MTDLWPFDPETGEILEDTRSNVAEFSVSEISQALKRTLEEGFSHVRVRGEISGYRGPHTSGHAYFALKDKTAKLDAVIWKGSFARLRSSLQEGLEVVASGKISAFPGSSKYQLIVEGLEPAGVGALMALLEERKRKLAAEGLFDPARKKPLPYLPRVIGVVTSPTGAVIRDILQRLNERFPRHVMVWPVRVQGDTCAAEVTAAIQGFNAMPEKPDLIIVARGGGSLEDLWGFNEESVVRAAAASRIPLISAVGHETDWTLIDHAADQRCPTPTAAAEYAVPVRTELIARLATLAARQARGFSRTMDERQTRLRSAVRALPKPDDLLSIARQRFDAAAGRLTQALRANTHSHEMQFQRLASRLTLQPVRLRIAACDDRLARLSRQAQRAMQQAIALRRSRLASEAKLLASLSYRSVLQRGFALVRDVSGHPRHFAAEVQPGEELELEFADGKSPVRALAPSGSKQGSLF